MMKRAPIIYQYFRRLLRAGESWNLSDRRQWQAEKLGGTLNAARRLRAYKDLAGTPILDWPYLKKGDLLANPQAFLGRRFFPSKSASTGGTTGVPLSLRRSPISIAFEQAAIDHVFSLAGVAIESKRIAILRGDYVKPPSDMTPPYWRKRGRSITLSSFHLTPQTFPLYLEELERFRPDVLMAYPSSLSHLIKLLQSARDKISIPYVFTSSERLSSDLADSARTTLGAFVIDYYGQAERVCMAYSLNNADYFFQPLYGYVEFAENRDGRAVIVGTPYWNNHQTLVRYYTGDVVDLSHVASAEYEEVRLGLKAFKGVEGRENEYIDLSDGRRIIGLNHIPRGVAGISSLQLRQMGPVTVEAIVVPRTSSLSEEARSQIVNNFYLKFPKEVEIRVRTTDQPLRLPNGKAPLLVP